MLEFADNRHLEAAVGWLELGNHLEAAAEIEKIELVEHGRPEVLEVRAKIHGLAGRFDEAVNVLNYLVALTPERRITAYYELAVYACRHNRVEEARQFLRIALLDAPTAVKEKALGDSRLLKAWAVCKS